MASTNPQKYTFFWKSESPFSQWFKCKFTVDGTLYNCAEQFMMQQKALLFGDEDIADKIMTSSSQKEHKSLGRKVSNFSEEKWNANCRKIVYKANLAKFSQNKDLQQKLVETKGTLIVEASPVDTIWGIGYAEDHPNARDSTMWRGENRLGFILTDVRDAILRGDLSSGEDYTYTHHIQTCDNADTQLSKGKFAPLTPQNEARSPDGQTFTFFWKSESPFSQFYPCNFVVDGVTYNCAEQYMMHQKAVLFKDFEIADAIMKTDVQRKQKALGRKVSDFNDQVWNENCKQIVYKGNLAKFSQNADLKKLILATEGTVLAEASPVDCIWGIGYKVDHPNAKKRSTWRGENRLGFILTEVREAILKGDVPEKETDEQVKVEKFDPEKQVENKVELPRREIEKTELKQHPVSDDLNRDAGQHGEMTYKTAVIDSKIVTEKGRPINTTTQSHVEMGTSLAKTASNFPEMISSLPNANESIQRGPTEERGTESASNTQSAEMTSSQANAQEDQSKVTTEGPVVGGAEVSQDENGKGGVSGGNVNGKLSGNQVASGKGKRKKGAKTKWKPLVF